MESIFNKAKHALHSNYKAAVEYVVPTLKDSQFMEKGVLTPGEFVLAGDQLIGTCKTWQWESGEKSKAANFLPPGKQFLITRSVPCCRRVSSLERSVKEETVENDKDGGWLNTHAENLSSELEAMEIKDDEFEEKKRAAQRTEDQYRGTPSSKGVEFSKEG